MEDLKFGDVVKITSISPDRSKRFLMGIFNNKNDIWANQGDNFICLFIKNVAENPNSEEWVIKEVLFNNQKYIFHTIAWNIEKL